MKISIHAPRVGSDSVYSIAASTPSTFQSTLPVWGATAYSITDSTPFQISIHAPRVGSDASPSHTKPFLDHFNPRSPCGERL